MAPQLGQVVEGVGVAQLTSVNQAHEQFEWADRSDLLRIVKRVYPFDLSVYNLNPIEHMINAIIVSMSKTVAT
jgi:hypothetical protein